MNLQQAIGLIELGLHKGKALGMIEFEDGSGQCFNYRLLGDKQARFVDLRYYDRWILGDNSPETLKYLIDHSGGVNQEMYKQTLKLRHRIDY